MNRLGAAALVLAFVPTVPSASDGTVTLTVQRGAQGQVEFVRVEFQLDARTVALSGKRLLTVSVEGPAPLRVDLSDVPLAPASAAIWKSNAAGAASAEPTSAGRERWQRTFWLHPYSAGESVPLMPAALTVRAGTSADSRIEWERPLSVRVTTDVDPADPGRLRPLAPSEPVPAAIPTNRGDALWAAVAIAVLAGLAALIAMRRGGRRVRSAEDAVQAANRALDRLALSEAPDGDAAQELGDILRRFIEFRCLLPATRMTSSELLAALAPANAFGTKVLAEIGQVLQAADVAKFTSSAPLVDRRTFVGLREIVRRFVSARAQPAQSEQR